MSAEVSVLIELGTLFAFIAVIVWIIVVDSRRRWPHLTWWRRAVAVLTFQRHP